MATLIGEQPNQQASLAAKNARTPWSAPDLLHNEKETKLQ